MKPYRTILISVMAFFISLSISFNALSDSSDWFVINNNDPCTMSRDVTLPSMFGFMIMQQGKFRVSEDPSFENIPWTSQLEQGPLPYKLSEGYGLKTVYIEVGYFQMPSHNPQNTISGWITNKRKDAIIYAKNEKSCVGYLKRYPFMSQSSDPKRQLNHPPQR